MSDGPKGEEMRLWSVRPSRWSCDGGDEDVDGGAADGGQELREMRSKLSRLIKKAGQLFNPNKNDARASGGPIPHTRFA